jgi:predicted SprT family Zn-dependent metalloprotease
MVSLVPKPDGTLQLRLQEAFLAAPRSVLAALRRYIRQRRRKDWAVVTTFIDTLVVPGSKESGGVWTSRKEHVHNLETIARAVNKRFFNGRIHCAVTWGRPPVKRRGRRSRSIRYGSWSAATHTIRINPLLDDKRVPRDFVAYIVFHEMLHTVVPSVRQGNRRIHHTHQFRALERGYPNLEAMQELSRRLLDRL